MLAGLHLEGPFISKARCGAHDPALLREPEPASLRRLLRAGRGTVRMITVAPELEHGMDAVRLLTEQGVIAAVGHTDATYAQAPPAIEARRHRSPRTCSTRMRPVHHREPGPVAALDAGVACEVVNDGLHVHPSVVSLMFAAAGAHRIALITDAIVRGRRGRRGVQPRPAQPVRVRDGEARLTDGESLAG